MRVHRAVRVLLWLTLLAAPASALRAQSQPRRPSAAAAMPTALVTFLRDWMRANHDSIAIVDPTTSGWETWAISAPLSLGRGQPRAQAVYLSGRPWCGTSGCDLLIVIEDSAGTMRFAGDVGLAQLPIRVLDTRHDGWPDLGVTVFGGGAQPREALVRSDGRAYQSETTPDLPTVPAHALGHVLLADTMPETRLWPVPRSGTSVQRCLVVVRTTFGPMYEHRRCPTR